MDDAGHDNTRKAWMESSEKMLQFCSNQAPLRFPKTKIMATGICIHKLRIPLAETPQWRHVVPWNERLYTDAIAVGDNRKPTDFI